MVTFKDFCMQFSPTSEGGTDALNINASDLTPELKAVADGIIKAMKNPAINYGPHNYLDDKSLDNIQDELSDKEKVSEIIASFNDGEIPDVLLEYLSRNLLVHSFVELDETHQSIIKTLVAYIIVSTQNERNAKPEPEPITKPKEDNPMSAPTRSHLTEIPVKHARISSSDVVAHLQDLLGFGFDCDFILCDNRADWEKPMTTNKCYVIMRAVFRPEDITVPTNSSEYVDKVLKATSAGTQYREDVMNTLKPFMFPQNMAAAKQQPEILQRLAEQGVAGNRLEELMRRPNIFYDQVNQRFGLYLRPERIINDIIVRHYGTNGVFNGVMSFGYLAGDNQNAAAITWGINVYENMTNTPSGITIDAVFAGIKA